MAEHRGGFRNAHFPHTPASVDIRSGRNDPKGFPIGPNPLKYSQQGRREERLKRAGSRVPTADMQRSYADYSEVKRAYAVHSSTADSSMGTPTGYASVNRRPYTAPTPEVSPP